MNAFTKAGIVVAATLITGIGGVVAWKAWGQYHVQRTFEDRKVAFAEDEARAKADIRGGMTPGASLAMLADAIERRDPQDAQSLVVPALRDRIAAIAQGDGDKARLIEQVRQLAENAGEGFDGKLVMTSPAYVELIQYPNGVWKVASF